VRQASCVIDCRESWHFNRLFLHCSNKRLVFICFDFVRREDDLVAAQGLLGLRTRGVQDVPHASPIVPFCIHFKCLSRVWTVAVCPHTYSQLFLGLLSRQVVTILRKLFNVVCFQDFAVRVVFDMLLKLKNEFIVERLPAQVVSHCKEIGHANDLPFRLIRFLVVDDPSMEHLDAEHLVRWV